MSAGRWLRTKARTSSANWRSSGVKARSMRPSRAGFSVGRSLAASPVGTSAQQPDGGWRRRDAEPIYVGMVRRQAGRAPIARSIWRIGAVLQAESGPQSPIVLYPLDPRLAQPAT